MTHRWPFDHERPKPLPPPMPTDAGIVEIPFYAGSGYGRAVLRYRVAAPASQGVELTPEYIASLPPHLRFYAFQGLRDREREPYFTQGMFTKPGSEVN